MKKLTPECIEAVVSLQSKKGKLEPDQVIEEAVAEESPAHYYFEWDNEIAGPAYRLSQARELISRIKFIVEQPNNAEPLECYRFTRDVEVKGNEQGYINVNFIKPKNVNTTLIAELDRSSAYLMRALTLAMVREDALPEGTIQKIEEIKEEIDSLIESL
jgi:hypothetical protein